MTRKRLKKLLMAKGYDRNCANDAINQCLVDGMNHEETFEELAGDSSIIARILRSNFISEEFWEGLKSLNEALANIKQNTGL